MQSFSVLPTLNILVQIPSFFIKLWKYDPVEVTQNDWDPELVREGAELFIRQVISSLIEFPRLPYQVQ